MHVCTCTFKYISKWYLHNITCEEHKANGMKSLKELEVLVTFQEMVGIERLR